MRNERSSSGQLTCHRFIDDRNLRLFLVECGAPKELLLCIAIPGYVNIRRLVCPRFIIRLYELLLFENMVTCCLATSLCSYATRIRGCCRRCLPCVSGSLVVNAILNFKILIANINCLMSAILTKY